MQGFKPKRPIVITLVHIYIYPLVFRYLRNFSFVFSTSLYEVRVISKIVLIISGKAVVKSLNLSLEGKRQ